MTGKLITVTKPNSISMLWLLPQYFIITAAEILFSITGLEFSYSQAPVSMKSVLTAAFLLTDSFGNLLVVVIEALKFSDRAVSSKINCIHQKYMLTIYHIEYNNLFLLIQIIYCSP